MFDPAITTDLARYAHILAVGAGFGTAFLADYHLISRLRQPVDGGLLQGLGLYHCVIGKMIAMMWITGLILVAIRTGFLPSNFTPKLISKLVIVAILTGNAVLIGRVAMPLVWATQGRSLLSLPARTKLGLAIIGALSSASWLLAMAMGSSKVLAASEAPVFVVLLPLAYSLAILVALAVIGTSGRLVQDGGVWPTPMGKIAAGAHPDVPPFPAE